MNAPVKIDTSDRRTDSLVRIGAVCKRTGLSVATVYRREAEGTFPRKVRMGPKMVGWYLSDVEDWIVDPEGYCAIEPAHE